MFLKRIFDILASFIGLIIFSPVFLIIAILIRLNMHGPVLFLQLRAGRHSKPFTIYKFRTMTLNNSTNTVTVKGDSRITSLGAMLRRYKLDELPELLNVLKGDMSLVGPRPDMPEYAEKLVGEEKLILELRPGITGPATLIYANEEELLASLPDPVNYNKEVIWPDKVRINLDYYHNRSFNKDILIIIKTLTGKKISGLQKHFNFETDEFSK